MTDIEFFELYPELHQFSCNLYNDIPTKCNCENGIKLKAIILHEREQAVRKLFTGQELGYFDTLLKDQIDQCNQSIEDIQNQCWLPELQEMLRKVESLQSVLRANMKAEDDGK